MCSDNHSNESGDDVLGGVDYAAAVNIMQTT